LEELREDTLEAFENQECQFEDLVEKLSLRRDFSRNPAFDAMFHVFELDEQSRRSSGAMQGEQTKTTVLEHKIARFDITLIVYAGDMLKCVIEYSTKLFKAVTIQRYLENFKEIVSAVVKDRQVKLKNIDISLGLSEIVADIPQINFEF
jgi:non-ribosomal peptide synthetase component F